MFEHYVHYQAGDPRWRTRLRVAAIASGVTTFSLVAFMWVASKMNINRVDPPTNVDTIVMQMTEAEAPPPPPPPPPPAGSDQEPEPEEEDIPDEEIPLEEDIVQPEEKPDKVPEPTKQTGPKGPKIPGQLGGQVGGQIGGMVGGMVGGMAGGTQGVATKKKAVAERDVAKKPIKAVKANALFSPDPPQKKLQGTKAATFDKRPGTTKVSFCVTTTGKVSDVRTTKKFRGDPKVDQICRDTVKKWRFKPFMVGGKPQKTCSVVAFDIEFK